MPRPDGSCANKTQRTSGVAPNSSQKPTRPGAGPPAEPACQHTRITASRRLQIAVCVFARAPRQPPCRVGFGTWALAVQLRLKPLARRHNDCRERHRSGTERCQSVWLWLPTCLAVESSIWASFLSTQLRKRTSCQRTSRKQSVHGCSLRSSQNVDGMSCFLGRRQQLWSEWPKRRWRIIALAAHCHSTRIIFEVTHESRLPQTICVTSR